MNNKERKYLSSIVTSSLVTILINLIVHFKGFLRVMFSLWISLILIMHLNKALAAHYWLYVWTNKLPKQCAWPVHLLHKTAGEEKSAPHISPFFPFLHFAFAFTKCTHNPYWICCLFLLFAGLCTRQLPTITRTQAFTCVYFTRPAAAT